jgi:hypothetical protein
MVTNLGSDNICDNVTYLNFCDGNKRVPPINSDFAEEHTDICRCAKRHHNKQCCTGLFVREFDIVPVKSDRK